VEPTLEIGVESGAPEYMLAGVRAAISLDDGRIALANAGTYEVRLYQPDGIHSRSFGRQGQGPAEFEYVWTILDCVPDELWVLVLPYAVERFDFDGNHLGTLRITLPRTGPPYGAPGCNRAGQFVAYGWGDLSVREDHMRPQSGAFLLSRDLEVIADLGTVPGSERWKTSPHPYGKQTVVGMTLRSAYVGTADGYELLEYDLDGTLTRKIRWRGADLTIGADEVARFRQWAPTGEPGERGIRVEDILVLEFPETYPAYTALLTDPQDNLWLRAFAPPGVDRERWTVLSPEGAWLGDLELNERFTLSEVGADYLLGIYRDDLDNEFVRKYALDR